MARKKHSDHAVDAAYSKIEQTTPETDLPAPEDFTLEEEMISAADFWEDMGEVMNSEELLSPEAEPEVFAKTSFGKETDEQQDQVRKVKETSDRIPDLEAPKEQDEPIEPKESEAPKEQDEPIEPKESEAPKEQDESIEPKESEKPKEQDKSIEPRESEVPEQAEEPRVNRFTGAIKEQRDKIRISLLKQRAAREERAKERALQRERRAQEKKERQEAKERHEIEMAKLKTEHMLEKQRLKDERRLEKRQRWEAGRKTRRRILMGFTTLLVLILLVGGAAYYHYVQYFSEHFYKGTLINGIDVSYQTIEEVKTAIEADVSKYTLRIVTKDQTETLSANEIGWEYVDDKKVDQLMEAQDSWRWVTYLSNPRTYEVSAGTTFDEEMLDEAIEQLDCLNQDIVLPVDAALVETAEGTYTIEPEVEGNLIDTKKLKTVITDGLVAAADTVDIVQEDCYIHPEIYRDDEQLLRRQEDWNKLMAISLTYKFGNETETINAVNIKPYVRDNGETVTLSSDWIGRLVYGWAQKYDTYGRSVSFTTHEGYELEIPENGGYGWMLDQKAMMEDIATCLEEGTSGSRESIWIYKGAGWDNGGITTSYVEIDKSKQKLYLYEDGKLVLQTNIVTGTPGENTETEVGIYAVGTKEEARGTVSGNSVASSKVVTEYIVPFNGTQTLFSDVAREDYGKTIYKTNGTDGSVCVPAEQMKVIYDTVKEGSAVIIYESDEIKAEQEKEEGSKSSSKEKTSDTVPAKETNASTTEAAQNS